MLSLTGQQGWPATIGAKNLAICALMLVGLIGGTVGCGKAKPGNEVAAESATASTPSAAADVLRMSAGRLAHLYGDHPQAAVRFTGKSIEVDGVVLEVNAGASKTGVSIKLDGDGTPNNPCVQCFFAADQQETVSKLGMFRRATFRGRCEGMQGNNVILKDCALK